VYNGQGANARDQNDNLHVVGRATYPWQTESGQIYEMGIQAYHGEYVPVAGRYNYTGGTASSSLTSAGRGAVTSFPTIASSNGIKDERVGVSFMMYPQPFGLESEWNMGHTPGLNAETNIIEEKNLRGGYIQTMYKIDNFNFIYNNTTLIPFLKWQYFDGYNKAELNAPRNQVNDYELGFEWQIAPEVELVAEYHRMHRNNLVTGNTTNRMDYERFQANVLRLQLQYNY